MKSTRKRIKYPVWVENQCDRRSYAAGFRDGSKRSAEITPKLAKRLCERILQMNANLNHVGVVTTEMVAYLMTQVNGR